MSVTDVGVAVTDLRVVCKIIACRVQNYRVRSSCRRNFLEMLKAAAGRSVAGYAKDAIVRACHRTNDGQEHKIIWRAEPEQDTIFYLRVTACRDCEDERLAWVASRGQWTSYSNSFVSKLLGANYNRANNFHPVADKLITRHALTGSNL